MDPLTTIVRQALTRLGCSAHRRPVAGAVVVNGDRDVLLAYSTFAGQGWHFPKGGIDEGEDVPSAAQREAFEETGVTAAPAATPLFPVGLGSVYSEPL